MVRCLYLHRKQLRSPADVVAMASVFETPNFVTSLFPPSRKLHLKELLPSGCVPFSTKFNFIHIFLQGEVSGISPKWIKADPADAARSVALQMSLRRERAANPLP